MRKCYRSLDWNNPKGVNCATETTPIPNTATPIDVGTDRKIFTIAAEVVKSMKVKVNFLNITTLSEYRKDAHPSVYILQGGKFLTPKQKSDPAKYADCVHWCIPGLPDTWNELLYAFIVPQS